MRFYLTKRETTHQSIKRIFLELVNKNSSLLNEHGENVDKSIHDARKNFKKLRAVLRFVRSDLDILFYKSHNIHFRNLSRKISGLRDSFVIIESLQKLLNEQNRNTNNYDDLIQSLQNDHHNTKNRILFEENAPLSVVSSLRYSVSEFENLPSINDGFSTLKSGLNTIYSKGKFFLDLTYSEPSSEVFHELRKNVKYLWHLLQIIQPINYRKIKKLTIQFKQLSDFIGDEHDLHELHQIIIQKNIEDFELLKMIRAKQFELKANAWKLAEELYKKSPKDFVDELNEDFIKWKEK